MKYADKCCLVYDHGLFVSLAQRLAEDFGRVIYYSPWEDPFPQMKAKGIGSGLPNVERVADWASVFEEVDIFVFPDLYDGEKQELFVRWGKRVWGARRGEELELHRNAAKRHFKSLGIPIGPYKAIEGTAALREHLKSNNDQFVKLSVTRGDGETFKASRYWMVDPVITNIEQELGPFKNEMEFTAESALEPAVETGYDGFTVDGKFPKRALWGIEVKSTAYVGRVDDYAAMPAPVRLVNDKLASTFREYKYRAPWPTEIRVTPDGVGYFIDATARSPSPPSELQYLMIENLAEIIWNGAAGILIEPKYKARWGAQLILFSQWAQGEPQPIRFPPEVKDHVKLRNFAVRDGKHHYLPDRTGTSAIGSVVACGPTMQSAIEECKRIAKMVEGHSIEADASGLNKAQEQFAKVDATFAKKEAA